MTTLLLLGARGQVGSELARALLPLGTIVAPDRSQCDLGNPQMLRDTVAAVRPDAIVNAAAYTAVDRAESEPARARAINADGPAELARAARLAGALLVHYSTDYVFDGRKHGPYVEDDAPNPLNVYGATKLAGEEAIQASGADHLIFRTSWVYAARGSNFLRTVLRLAGERDTLRIVDDQAGAPTWSRLIAETTAVALRDDLARRRNASFDSAVLHLTASGATSWHGFASRIVEGARARGAALRCGEIVPVATAEYPTAARRPANSRLALQRLSQRYALQMPDWERCLELCLDDLYTAADVRD